MDESSIDRLLPRFRLGVIQPGSAGVQRGADYQFYRLVPGDVMQIGVGLGIREYSDVTPEATLEVVWACIDALLAEEVDRVVLSGVPVSAALGRENILRLVKEVPNRTGKPFHATLEAIVAGLEFLGARRITMASRFPSDTNAAIVAYFSEADIEVIASTSRELSLSQARRLSMRDGMQLALDVGREAAALAPDAEALVIPGGATLSLHAIPALEAELNRPVIVNLSAEVWHALVSTGIIPPVDGWGRLLAMKSH
jgi:maleate cis-trans isomerase